MPDAVKYTPAHIDGLIRATTKGRSLQMKQQQQMAARQEADRRAALENVEHEGFCVKCRDKKRVVTAGEAEHSNGMKSIHGVCPDCNTNVHRFIPKMKETDG